MFFPLLSSGNLALARALGDFEYKKNANISAEKQIITADPEIVEHKITDDDEFLIIACDGRSLESHLLKSIIPNPYTGIWDCLTSQQCVDAVRLLISQGKELPEIAEIICELCLAPDTESGGGIGCDNMTMLVVALLGGRTKDEWRAWVTDRVKNRFGHATPEALPQLYSQSRLMAFKARRAAEETRGKLGRPGPDRDSFLQRFLDRPRLDEDMDSDDSDDDMDEPFPPRRNLIPNSLTKLQLNGEAGRSGPLEMDDDEDMAAELFIPPPHETPTALKPVPNGITMEQKPRQFESLPGSDEASPAVKAEGLMDTSEDPLKG